MFSDFPHFELLIQILKKPPVKRSANDLKSLIKSIESIDFFKNLAIKNGRNSLLKLCTYLEYEFCPQSNTLFAHGTKGTRFYIILQGSVGVLIPLSKTENVIINSPKLNRRSSLITSTKPTFIEVKELHSGDSFGELALISNKVRASSIVCKEDCHFAYLEKKGFEAVLLDLEKQKLMEGLNFLEKIPIFNNVIQKTLLSLYFGFQSKKFSKGNIIYKENSIPTSVFLIKDGEFLIFKEVRRKTKTNQNIFKKDLIKLALLYKGDIIGDEDLDLEDEKCIREYSVVCESMEGEVLEMKQIDFIKIMKKEDVLIWNSIVFESRNKKFRLNQRVFEYFNVVSEKKTLVNFQNGRKLQELFKVKTQESTQNFNSNGFQKIESEISRFNYQQAELKNCQKLKSLRLFTKLNEFEEAYDKIQGKKISNSYTSSLIGEFKEKIDQIEKKHFTHRYSKGENEFKSNSIEFSNNPLLLKNIGYFSPKYTRIVNIIHRKRKLPSYNLSKKP